MILSMMAVALVSQWLWPILLLVLGLGAVVFFHELGHFAVAKMVGIKVERFALGFGPRFAGIKIGETDYCICLLPLGGYVKMLGQEDFKPLEDNEKPDPRSYNSKTVGQRLAVVSAGVIMNIILAALLFIVIGMVGKKYAAPYVGDVLPGFSAAQATIEWQDQAPPQDDLPMAPLAAATTSPTTQAVTAPATSRGLKAGDKILTAHGPSLTLSLLNNEITNFADVNIVTLLADPGEVYTFTIERVVDGKAYIGRASIATKMGESHPIVGIAPAAGVVFDDPAPYIFSSPFKPDDKLVAINGQNIEHSWDMEAIERRLDGGPVKVTVQREGQMTDVEVLPTLVTAETSMFLNDGSIVRGRIVEHDIAARKVKIEQVDGQLREVSLESRSGNAMSLLGMVPRLAVLAVEKGSRADKAGIKPGDVVVGYGDQGAVTIKQFLELSKKVASGDDGEVRISVLRDGQTLTMQVEPKMRGKDAQVGTKMGTDFRSVVADVIEGSLAAKAGIKRGAEIVAVNGQSVQTWLELYRELSGLEGQEVTLTVKQDGQSQPMSLGVLSSENFWAGDYRYDLLASQPPLGPMLVEIRHDNPLKALAWGGRETLKLLLSTYASFGSLAKGNVSTDTLQGPIGIGSAAIQLGRRDLTDFLYFLGIISVALAVFNFLPIPVVDGGHAVFLIIEKIRGKPLPVKVINVVQLVGLVLILGLFIVVTWNDVTKLFRDSWL